MTQFQSSKSSKEAIGSRGSAYVSTGYGLQKSTSNEFQQSSLEVGL